MVGSFIFKKYQILCMVKYTVHTYTLGIEYVIINNIQIPLVKITDNNTLLCIWQKNQWYNNFQSCHIIIVQ